MAREGTESAREGTESAREGTESALATNTFEKREVVSSIPGRGNIVG